MSLYYLTHRVQHFSEVVQFVEVIFERSIAVLISGVAKCTHTSFIISAAPLTSFAATAASNARTPIKGKNKTSNIFLNNKSPNVNFSINFLSHSLSNLSSIV